MRGGSLLTPAPVAKRSRTRRRSGAGRGGADEQLRAPLVSGDGGVNFHAGALIWHDTSAKMAKY